MKKQELKYVVGQEVQWDGTDGQGARWTTPGKVIVIEVDRPHGLLEYTIKTRDNRERGVAECALLPLDNRALITAIEGSRAHHMEGKMCTIDNYRDFDLSSNKCALCGLHDNQGMFSTENCGNCFLDDTPKTCGCCVEYRRAVDGRNDWDFPMFHEGEVGILKRLDRELERLRGSTKHLTYTQTALKVKLQQDYQVGDEIVVSDGKGHGFWKDWLGLKLKIVSFGDTSKKYEMWIDNGLLDDSGFPDGKAFIHASESPIVRCIDPRFWTVERDGVLYRAYEAKYGQVRIYWVENDDVADWHVWETETLAKTLNIPIMPYGYMGEDYAFEYPVREKK